MFHPYFGSLFGPCKYFEEKKEKKKETRVLCVVTVVSRAGQTRLVEYKNTVQSKGLIEDKINGVANEFFFFFFAMLVIGSIHRKVKKKKKKP